MGGVYRSYMFVVVVGFGGFFSSFFYISGNEIRDPKK